jgi:CheY-like chemotaxis protein
MASKANILIVDDSKNNQEICRICLEPEDYTVYFAQNGEQGLNLVNQVKPDLILLDIMMPVMDGYQMLERLKSDPVLKDIPVLVLAVITDMDDVVKAFKFGANDFLKKPFNVGEFIARVNRLIKHKQNQDAINRYNAQILKRQKIFEFELNKWAREAESLQQKFDTTLSDISDKFDADGNLEQMLSAAKQAKILINRIISMSRLERYEQISAV